MGDKESLAERLNRLAQQKKAEEEAEKHVQKTQEEVNQFIFANAMLEFENLLNILERKVSEVNPNLRDLPQFEFSRGGPYVKQGNVAAFLSFIQPILNAPPIVLRLSFGREPQGFYIDFDSSPPEPERYKLQPAMERSLGKLVWVGDLGETPSEQLSDFILNHLTEYYLEHRPSL
ncbi:MAG TPA: hypothetical protein VG204_15905 [Terriglobia bacterium]|nr:hypothetical protein [Terriglobia bacterium]